MLPHRLAWNTDVYSLPSDNNYCGFRGNVKNVLLAGVAGLCITQCNISCSFFPCALQFQERDSKWACNFIKERITFSKRSSAITLCEAEWGKMTRWGSMPFCLLKNMWQLSVGFDTLIIRPSSHPFSPKTRSLPRRTDQTSCSQETLFSSSQRIQSCFKARVDKYNLFCMYWVYLGNSQWLDIPSTGNPPTPFVPDTSCDGMAPWQEDLLWSREVFRQLL